MQFKDSRKISFLIIFVIYLLASAVGIVSYFFLPVNIIWLKLLIADILATAFTFIFSVILKNASVYDPYWSVQPIVILYVCMLMHGTGASGILILVVVSIWGIRLTANWAYTFNGLSHQDWRYSMLKEKTGRFYPIINFFGIHIIPTLVVYACTLPALYVVLFSPAVNFGSVIFFIVSISAVILQGIADIQMHTYRKSRTTVFMRTGLWKFSRHPNYLGEIMMWWGIAFSAICVLPNLWWLIIGAILNTLLFLFVSIPMADKRQSYKPGFDEYKKSTHMLLPIKKF